jgi:glucose-1-phosphate adenylyltransferase
MESEKNILHRWGFTFSMRALEELMSDPETKDFGKEIIPQAVGNRNILSYTQYEGYWTDIGNIDSFFEANIGLTDDIPQFNLFDNDNKNHTRPRLLPLLNSTFIIEESLISEGCIIQCQRN